MRILIFIGLLIVFISAFFSIMIFEVFMRSGLRCMADPEGAGCQNGSAGPQLAMGSVMIALFLLVDVATVYIILKAVSAGDSYSSYPNWAQRQ
jgi:hypothetical protein